MATKKLRQACILSLEFSTVLVHTSILKLKIEKLLLKTFYELKLASVMCSYMYMYCVLFMSCYYCRYIHVMMLYALYSRFCC